MDKFIKENIEWIESGKIGCVFASALVKQAGKIGWHFSVNPESLIMPDGCFILSIIFPDADINSVRDWAIKEGMYLESVDDMYNGLRIKLNDGVAWVQYFGKDSHVKTRQCPHPMLSFTCKLRKKYYFKVGWNGILHLANASIEYITDKAADTLWNQSIAKTKKELGHSPRIAEAAKSTYKK